ncbi:hypothetical protein SOVF_084640 isoform A [Spinacia oleracea]|uniref:Uncharacterized protein isoform X2 n=1 Tax=Spinacia oleracea TaxID=3562 RepID=A0A9R0JE41_SPIOL|nr:uncharacterized protein LOC110804549 isoform X2 [Spinacia oleracea]KNA16939.1 hypothetical protein SOVF_084640 isoform A [Spinacia oleracea]
MGADPNSNQNGNDVVVAANFKEEEKAPLVLGLQPSALVDHVARVNWSLLDQIPGERGGSIPVALEDVEHILAEVKTHITPTQDDLPPIKTLGGGSVANTIRGLSACFDVTSGLVGACGDDEQGQLFMHNMSSKDVDLSRMRTKKGATAQCVCLVDAVGNRTMRPSLAQAVRLKAEELIEDNFRGSKWLVMRFAAINLELIHAAVRIAKRDGLLVSLDLASFEMVRSHKSALVELLESGDIDLCFANEDEAMEVVRGKHDTSPEAALDYLATHCRWAVVTLGSKGCIAKHEKETVKLPAIWEARPCDATGAGDLFASGFLYGLIKGLSIEDCCRVGSCSGGSVIRSLGGDVTPDNRNWMYKQMQIKDLPLPKLDVACC